MGQYYRIVNLDKRETLDAFAFDGGHLKLMESCRVGNAYVDAITYLMTNDWRGDTVLFCGDYAWDLSGSANETLRELADEDPYRAADAFADRSGDFASARGNKVFREITPGRWDEVPVEGSFRINAGHYRYVVNKTLGVYYDREKAPVSWVGWWKGEPVINRTDPLTIFMAVGNGLGGGDYGDDRPNVSQVGSWAGHVVFGANEPPAGLAEIECPFDESGLFVTEPDAVIKEAVAAAHLNWARTSTAEVADAVAELLGKRRGENPIEPGEGKKMVEDVLLEYDEESECALLLRMGDKHHEYVVAYRYSPTEGGWQQGSYHETFEAAAVDYSSCIGGPSLEIAPEDCFCAVRWCDDDLMSYLENAYGKPYATDENVERCKDMMRGGRSLADMLAEEGWAIIDAIVDPSLLVAES